MAAPNSKRPCLYCGVPTKKGKKGEHIVQEAVGGAKTLNDVDVCNRVVCPSCNSGFLSHIDRELCSRSYLSVIASQEIAAHLWQAWDVDHAANHLLVEARPSWADDETLSCLVAYPQITLERTGPEARGDAEEVVQFGREDFAKVLFRAVRQCFERYCAGKNGALHFERVQSGVIHDGYRLAPRIFTRHSISEIAQNINEQSFILRFANEEDKQFALQCLSKLNSEQHYKGWSQKIGSRYPTISLFFDIGETLRGLMKIGLNLVAAYCPNTPVNHETFADAIRVIRGEVQIPPHVLAANGFVHAEDVQGISGAANEHAFRLMHTGQVWHVYSSFFGGRIGAHVRLPGPNHEEWRCANIVAPMKSKDWTIGTSPILQALKTRVEWNDSRTVTPSLKFQRTVSSMRVDVVRKK